MGRQPYYRPFEPSGFFPDGRSARSLPAGTVARGQLRDDQPVFTGKDGSGSGAVLAASLLGFGADVPFVVASVLPPIFEKMAVADYITAFPFPVTMEVLERAGSDSQSFARSVMTQLAMATAR